MKLGMPFVSRHRFTILGVVTLIFAIGVIAYVFRPLTIEEQTERLVSICMRRDRTIWARYFSPSDEWIQAEKERLGQAMLPTLVDMLGDPDVIRCSVARSLISETYAPGTVEFLMETFEVSEQRVQVNILATLHSIAQKSSFDALASLLDHNQSWVRSFAAALLGHSRAKADTYYDVVFRCVDDPSPEVRKSVLHTLARLDSQRAYKTLIHALQEDESEKVVMAAAELLYRTGNPQAVPALKEALLKWPDDSEGQIVHAIRILESRHSEEAMSDTSARIENDPPTSDAPGRDAEHTLSVQ